MKIGIAGAGGIGSNVAVYLVRSGIQSLKIVDFDTVEQSNLNRQFYFQNQIGHPKVEMLANNLNRISPAVHIKPINQRITDNNIDSIFSDCEIIVEGFDTVPEKKMLLERFASTKQMVVSASGIAGGDTENITTKKLGNCFVVGDFEKDCRYHSLYAHKVALVAAKMTEIILAYRAEHAGT